MTDDNDVETGDEVAEEEGAVAYEEGVGLAEQEASEQIGLLGNYPQHLADRPEIIGITHSASLSKTNMSRYKDIMFVNAACLAGLEVELTPTTNLLDLHQRSWTAYSNLLKDSGFPLLMNTIGIFNHLPAGKIPSETLGSLVDFTKKKINLGTRAGAKTTKTVVSDKDAENLIRGKIIWETFKYLAK